MMDDIRKTLWSVANKLPANMDAAKYTHLVLGLIFLKFISDTFAGRQAELRARFADESDEYHFLDASADDLVAELEDRDYYTAANIFWVSEVVRWESLRAAAKQPGIGKRIDALTTNEAESPKLKGILDKRYGRAHHPDGKLGELVDLVSTIGFGSDANAARDILGQMYTPCCGSGDMFVQSEKFIEAHRGKIGDGSIYGQESNPAAWRLAAMNLAIRGLDFNLGEGPLIHLPKSSIPTCTLIPSWPTRQVGRGVDGLRIFSYL